MTAEWVSAWATVAAAVGVLFVGWQAFSAAQQLRYQKEQLEKTTDQLTLAYQEMQNDHERSRREFTISLMKDWTLNLSHSSTIARKLVEGFSFEQCKAINSHGLLKVEKSKKEKITAVLQDVLGGRTISEENDFLVIEERDVSHLKYLLITYLNTLETILMSWKLAVADKEILEQEFSYLVKPEDGHEALATFRQVVGGTNAYPAIHSFVEKIKLNREKTLPSNRGEVA